MHTSSHSQRQPDTPAGSIIILSSPRFAFPHVHASPEEFHLNAIRPAVVQIITFHDLQTLKKSHRNDPLEDADEWYLSPSFLPTPSLCKHTSCAAAAAAYATLLIPSWHASPPATTEPSASSSADYILPLLATTPSGSPSSLCTRVKPSVATHPGNCCCLQNNRSDNSTDIRGRHPE